MKHSKEPKNQNRLVALLGPPGSGKGTQASLLAEKFNLYHLETSKIIEKNFLGIKKGDFAAIGGKRYYLIEEKKKRELGELMSPPLIAFWVKKKIKELAREGEGIITSGSPRTLYEGKELIPVVEKIYGLSNITVILLELSEKGSIQRNSHRRICGLMRHSILHTRETERLTECPLDGSRLILRKDDNPETIKIRLKEYQERTIPLINYFRNKGLRIKKVDGEPSVVDVFESILKAIR